VGKGRNSAVVSVRLPDELLEAVKHDVKARGWSFSGLVEALLVGYLEGRRSSSELPPDGEQTAAIEESSSPGSAAAEKADEAVNAYLKAHGTPGRNARCPCGSGRKYKNCHLVRAAGLR
jgi:preprotein translocase subunit SecA